MPTVRHPSSLPIWPTADPTAPAAVETSRVSPGFGSPMPVSARCAVTPLLPHMPRLSVRGRSVSALLRPTAPQIGRAHVCTPVTNAQPVFRLPLETTNTTKHD